MPSDLSGGTGQAHNFLQMANQSMLSRKEFNDK